MIWHFLDVEERTRGHLTLNQNLGRGAHWRWNHFSLTLGFYPDYGSKESCPVALADFLRTCDGKKLKIPLPLGKPALPALHLL